MKKKHEDKRQIEEVVASFEKVNKEDGLRVFVAGGARAGKNQAYMDEVYQLGRQIVKLGMKLDFGLSSSGIMGAVAKGVIDGWLENKDKYEKLVTPINAITTQEYLDLYDKDDDVIAKIGNIVVADTLEDRKNKLLMADFIVFTPGGVGTLDELAYDCVAMQDGFIGVKPLILYNIDGFFHHLVEYLKYIAKEGFADPIPFIVVDNSKELDVALRFLKVKYNDAKSTKEAYANARQMVYELPYVINEKMEHGTYVEETLKHMEDIRNSDNQELIEVLENKVEKAYLEKEIERMYERLGKTGRDTSIVSEKLTQLKSRKNKKSI